MGDNKYVIDYGPGPLEQAQKMLGLVDLVNRVNAAPVEQAIKDNELKLKQNDVTQIETKNALEFQKLKSAVYDEERKSAEFQNSALLKIREGFQQDFQMGSIMLQQAIPGAFAIKKENGSVAISMPGQSPISINPGDITDPKEIASQTQDRVVKWGKASERYIEIFKSGNGIKAQLGLATAAGDIAAIYLRAKQLDPGGRVTEGDYNSVINSPNVSQQLKNMLTRAVNQDGPMFGDLSSPSRKAFLESSKVLVDQEKSAFLPHAKFFLEGQILGDKLDPQKIFSPAGDITLESLGYNKEKRQVVAPEPGAVVGPKDRAPQAGQQASPEAATPTPKINLKARTDAWLKNTMASGGTK